MIGIHQHSTKKIDSTHELYGKTVYLPAMDQAAATLLTAAFHWLGVDARVTPPSDARTLELAARVLGGDECYPAKITMGDVLKITEQPGFDPGRCVILMASSDGPCRLGQYGIYLRKVLQQRGLGGVEILSPTDRNGYAAFGTISGPFIRTAWRIIVASDILRKLLLRTRPYETEPGSSDKAFEASILMLESAIENSCTRPSCQLRSFREALLRIREMFNGIPVNRKMPRPRVAVMGELFCRLNTFSNENVVRKLEELGAEVLLSGMAEWIHYINFDETFRLKLNGQMWTLAMLGSKVRQHFQRADQDFLLEPFQLEFGDQPHAEMEDLLEMGKEYLPYYAVAGEMVISMGAAVHLSRSRVDGIVDVSPFTCMNGIVSEAIYPRIGRECGEIPIRSLYFDGTQKGLKRELGVFMELVRAYRDGRIVSPVAKPDESSQSNGTLLPEMQPETEPVESPA
jgi:predicted nucleotide-binding protein (sugar kinase/HSP70/actin superfamily)